MKTKELKKYFDDVWKEYAECPDSKLTRDAIALKRKLISFAKEICRV
jgi:hypothetical protein